MAVFKLCGELLTDPSNASRTMLFDIKAGDWDPELLELFGVPRRSLPALGPSSGAIGMTNADALHGHAVPIAGVAGDQQAALFGQACLDPGLGKNTYGTGSFVLQNAGYSAPEPAEGLLSTVAWRIGEGRLTYALEAAIFVTGAAMQWLRDGLGIIDAAGETEPLARVARWQRRGLLRAGADRARLATLGPVRARDDRRPHPRRGRAHLARAALESIAYQTVDAVRAIERACAVELTELRADGGATVNDWLMQFQADVLGVPVVVPEIAETTALGAAYLAGVGIGSGRSSRSAPAGARSDATSRRWATISAGR